MSLNKTTVDIQNVFGMFGGRKTLISNHGSAGEPNLPITIGSTGSSGVLPAHCYHRDRLSAFSSFDLIRPATRSETVAP